MKAKKDSKAKGIPYNPTGGSSQLMSSSCASYPDMVPHLHKCLAGGKSGGCGSQTGMPDNNAEHYRTGSVIMANNNPYVPSTDGAVKRLADLTDQLNGSDVAMEYESGQVPGKVGKNSKKGGKHEVDNRKVSVDGCDREGKSLG